MADINNPYANPYLPPFVNRQAKLNQPSAPALQQQSYGQIHSVDGFKGAREYNLAPGASEILAEKDPNMAAIYIVARDTNGETFIKGYRLGEEITEPKPVTMDDLNAKMNEVLSRMSRLEEERVDRNGNQSVSNASWKGSKQPANAKYQPNGGNGQNGQESTGGFAANEPK